MSFDDFDFQAHAPPAPAPAPSPAPAHAVSPVAMPARMERSSAPRVSPTAARAKAGLGIVVAGLGVGAGAVLAGPLGALAGLASVGTVRNLYRSQGIASADPTEQGDAARSLALGVIGVAIVGFIGYKIYSSRKDD